MIEAALLVGVLVSGILMGAVACFITLVVLCAKWMLRAGEQAPPADVMHWAQRSRMFEQKH